MTLIIFHDNGIAGQEGFSEECIFYDSEIPRLIEKYKQSGITILDYFIE